MNITDEGDCVTDNCFPYQIYIKRFSCHYKQDNQNIKVQYMKIYFVKVTFSSNKKKVQG